VNLGDDSQSDEKSPRSIQDLGIRKRRSNPRQYNRGEEELAYDEEEDEVEPPWWLWRRPRWWRHRRSNVEGCGGKAASPTGSSRGGIWTGVRAEGGAAARAGKRSRWRGGGALVSRRS